MKIERKWLAAGAAALLVVGALGWAFAPRPVAVELVAATRGRFESAIEEDGKTRLRDRYVLATPLAGVLSRIELREGDAVQAGAVVATLAPVPPPLQDARTLRELQLRVATARAQADAARARLGAAEVGLVRARSDAARSEQLARDGFVSPNKLDDDRFAVQAAQKDVESAAEARRAAGHEVEQALAALSALRQERGSAPFPLRAPASGRVLRVAQGSETALAAGTPVLELGDTRRLEVVAELLTSDALQALPGSRVVIDRWGGPAPLAGRVRSVEPGAFTKVSALGVEEQRVRVLIDLLSPQQQWQALGDGYRVNVRIVTLSSDDAVRVPVSALFPLPGSTGEGADTPGAMGVFMVEQGKAQLKAVEVAARNGSEAWVRRGLHAGDRVVVYPPASLRDGARVVERPA